VTFAHPKIRYIEVDLPPPSPLRSPCIEIDAVRFDKGCKYTIGLLHARKLNPTHVMFFDCDDFISDRIAGFVRQNPDANGWFVKDGYRYNALSRKCYLMNGNFHQICGTSHIIKSSLYDIPADLPLNADQERILNSLGKEYLYKIMGSHRFIADHLRQKGTPLRPLPFPGAIYHVAHGDNWSLKRNNKLPAVNLSEKACKEFNITDVQSHPLNDLWGYRMKSRIKAVIDKIL